MGKFLKISSMRSNLLVSDDAAEEAIVLPNSEEVSKLTPTGFYTASRLTAQYRFAVRLCYLPDQNSKPYGYLV